VNDSKKKPAWVDSPAAVYDTNKYLSRVGMGNSRQIAEKNALANLISFFGQSVQSEINVLSQESQSVSNGRTKSSSYDEIEETIRSVASMDKLIGAEIAEVWFDQKNTHYAVIVMDKARTIGLYTAMINDNLTMIEQLTTLDAAAKNSLEAYSRYRLAASLADLNRVCAPIITMVGGAPPAGLKQGDEYRLEALNIVKAIPIGVVVSGKDKANRIRGAFASAVQKAGFRNGGTTSRYVLEVSVDLSEAVFNNNPNKFVRYEISADLNDTTDGVVLFPFNINGREGHANVSEAENRAIAGAEKKVGETYTDALNEFLLSLMPQ
jgi:hypothetical protein